MASQKIIYSRGFPYGAPLVMLRGGGTRLPGVKEFLREQGFRWEASGRPSHAWETYMNRPELGALLIELRDRFGCEIQPKEGMDESYLLDLQHPKFRAPIHQSPNELRMMED
jgi:hypothetical protein